MSFASNEIENPIENLESNILKYILVRKQFNPDQS